MDALTANLSDLVGQFVHLTHDQILSRIGELEGLPNSESRNKAMKSIRYSLRHGQPPSDLTEPDIQAIRPLIVRLVARGLRNGGLGPEAMVGFQL
jgi:hypothetical protein